MALECTSVQELREMGLEDRHRALAHVPLGELLVGPRHEEYFMDEAFDEVIVGTFEEIARAVEKHGSTDPSLVVRELLYSFITVNAASDGAETVAALNLANGNRRTVSFVAAWKLLRPDDPVTLGTIPSGLVCVLVDGGHPDGTDRPTWLPHETVTYEGFGKQVVGEEGKWAGQRNLVLEAERGELKVPFSTRLIKSEHRGRPIDHVVGRMLQSPFREKLVAALRL
eukprot:TRINITY_DN17588_c0_g1_i1.p1 TRINITY_DN17588_c0_g1~~TRINITY_DN17588_c0_g1_i1.p1  ORF type:complete len:242 (+),score=75.63 TRINITY_DN17588_c0_g1_i1:49-726(+)